MGSGMERQIEDDGYGREMADAFQDQVLPEIQLPPLRSLAPTVLTGGEEERFPLIVHCHLRWDFVWQRPQQLFSRLAAHHRILFLEDPVADDGAARLEITEPCPGVVRVLPRLPGHGDFDAQCATVAGLLEAGLASHPLLAGRFESPVQWFYSPMTAPTMLGRFGARGVVYDCMDELANFRFAPPDMGAREQFLLAHSDIVFTGGLALYDAKSALHPLVYVHGCGVDVAHFGRARAPDTAVHPSVASLPGPVLGYFGVVDERLDYELIAKLADRFPDASVVMAGPFAKVDPAELPKRANIHWLGQQAYEDLPALVKGFDVCLMPFALNEATRYINPTKTLEYLAAGKPVVSTPIADVVRQFVPVVSVARSHGSFVDAVDQAARNPDRALIAEGISMAEAATWDVTVSRMRRELCAAVAPARASMGVAQ